VNVLLVFVATAMVGIGLFVAYWTGRDTGEKAGYLTHQEVNHNLTQANVQLKLEIERLRRERDVYAERAQRSDYPAVE
jgi:cell division protein FtsB